MSFDKSSNFREPAGALENCRLQSRIRQTRLPRYNVALCCEYFIVIHSEVTLSRVEGGSLLGRVELEVLFILLWWRGGRWDLDMALRIGFVDVVIMYIDGYGRRWE